MGLIINNDNDEFEMKESFNALNASNYFSKLMKTNEEFLKAIKDKDFDAMSYYLGLGYPISRRSVLFDKEQYLLLTDAMSDNLDEGMYLSSKTIYDLLLKEEYLDIFNFLIPHLYMNESERLFQDLYFRIEHDASRFDSFFNNLILIDEKYFNFFGWLKASFLNKNIFVADYLIDFYVLNKISIKKKNSYSDFSEINAINYFSYQYEYDNDGFLKVSDFIRTDAVLRYMDLIIDGLIEQQQYKDNFFNYMTEKFPYAKDDLWKENARRAVFNKIIVKGSIFSLFENYKDVGDYNNVTEDVYNIESLRFLMLKKFSDTFKQNVFYFLIDSVLLNINLTQATINVETKRLDTLKRASGWMSLSKRGLKDLNQLLDRVIVLAKGRLDPFELLDFLISRKFDENKYLDLKKYCALSKSLDSDQNGEKSSGRSKI